MKIDKSNPRHWLHLLTFSLYVLAGVLARIVLGEKDDRIVLYGHKLNGNLKALYDYLRGTPLPGGWQVFFLSLDARYRETLSASGVRCLNAVSFADIMAVCRSACIITDHGPHALYFLNLLTKTPFVDLWHGIPYKGFDHDDFFWLKHYTALFVASPSMAKVYRQRYGFAPHRIHVTGYGRTDRLVTGSYPHRSLCEKYGLDPAKKKVLLALTWNHGRKGRDALPFGLEESAIVGRLQEFAIHKEIEVLLRSHLNDRKFTDTSQGELRVLAADEYPQTEEILFVSDVLVTDWSSIAFDFLVLGRPTIFLATPSPFEKGFTYGPECRFGPIADDWDGFERMLARAVLEPEQLLGEFRDRMSVVREDVYGGYADGSSTKRYIAELELICRS